MQHCVNHVSGMNLDLIGGDGWTLNDAIFPDMHSVAGKI